MTTDLALARRRVMQPVRVQRKRTKDFRLQAASPNGLPVVYVGRPTKWGNPYRPWGIDGMTATQAVAEYRWALNNLLPGLRSDIVPELRGKNLACWCKVYDNEGRRVACHADILLQIANEWSADETNRLLPPYFEVEPVLGSGQRWTEKVMLVGKGGAHARQK